MISVVTVCYNAGDTIEQTIRSVIDQTYPDIEYLIIDGGSTDNSVDVIRSYRSRIAAWISEPDEGIADAMNKGLRRVENAFVLYLNADDYLIDSQALERTVHYLNTEIVAAPIVRQASDGSKRIVYPRGFNWWMNVKTGLFHQGTLCSTAMIRRLGGFDTRCRLEMDYDLFLRAYREQVSIRLIQEPLSVMRTGGVSTRDDPTTLRKRCLEEKEIHFRNCPNMAMMLFYWLYWQCYPSYKLARGRRNYFETGD